MVVFIIFIWLSLVYLVYGKKRARSVALCGIVKISLNAVWLFMTEMNLIGNIIFAPVLTKACRSDNETQENKLSMCNGTKLNFLSNLLDSKSVMALCQYFHSTLLSVQKCSDSTDNCAIWMHCLDYSLRVYSSVNLAVYLLHKQGRDALFSICKSLLWLPSIVRVKVIKNDHFWRNIDLRISIRRLKKLCNLFSSSCNLAFTWKSCCRNFD